MLIGEKLRDTLNDWLFDRSVFFDGADTNALFISQYGKRISYDAFRKLLLKYSEYVTYKKITPECLRHTCAINLYERTGDIHLTSAQLHHAHVSSTVRYVKAADRELEKARSIMDELI